MHITLEADYAVRIVDCIAIANARVDASTISDITGVTQRFSLKILRKLVAANIIKSFKGVKGGYELAKLPQDITLKDVIETVEGVYAFSRCVSPSHGCNCDKSTCKSGNCRFQKTYDEISEEVRKRLNEITFETK